MRDTGHSHAGSRRRIRTDATRGSLRRRLLVALGAGALAPFASIAQQPAKIPRTGFMGSASATSLASRVEAMRAGLRELGYVEGKSLLIEWRFADGKDERLPGLAAELVKLKVDVIVASSSPSIQAARQATAIIPIVMIGASDAVANGFAASLSLPGGNMTGVSNVSADVSIKYVELLREVVLKLSRVAVLVHPSNPSHANILKTIQYAAKTAGVKVFPQEALTESDIDTAFGAMARERVEALIVMADQFFLEQRRQIAERSIKNRLPTIMPNPESVEAGALMSYGWNVRDGYKRAATFVDKILKGAKPGDLPIEQPTKFEMAVNMQTAKALGIKIPNTILVRADRVIE